MPRGPAGADRAMRVPRGNFLGIPFAALALGLSGCAIGPYVEVPIEIPIEAKLDLSGYGRVLVGSFVTQTNENLDLDAETSRLLRNQLRLNSRLAVIEAEIEPLGNFSDAGARSQRACRALR